VHGVQAKQVVKYVFMPGIIPRLKRLLGSGFGYIAFLMASIYGMVRLLPPNHPYLNPRNIGHFNLRHVIGEAANNLVISKKNIDQLVIFTAMLAGLFILVMQFVLVLYAYVVQPAIAGSIFETVKPKDDIAYILLDNVFGVPDVFCNTAGECSAVQQGGDFPFAFHEALHAMLKFYSTGLLLIGLLIFLYFVVVVVVETAVSGTPFGQRFQNIWVPIRLVVAIGLLVPISNGLNSGQYIVLYAAKFGSGFATTGWLTFNAALGSSDIFGSGGANPTGERESLVAKPIDPSIAPPTAAMAIVQACAYAHWHMDKNKDNGINAPLPPSPNFYIRPYLVKNVFSWMSNTQNYMPVTESTTYKQALDFYNKGNIVIRFGRHDPEDFKSEKGSVYPNCGDISIHVNDVKEAGSNKGPDAIQSFYFEMIKSMWFGVSTSGSFSSVDNKFLAQMSRRYAAIDLPQLYPESNGKPIQCSPQFSEPMGCGNGLLPSCSAEDCPTHRPEVRARQSIVNSYTGSLTAATLQTWEEYNRTGTDIQIKQDVLDRGWAGAGIWYNTVNQVNGSFMAAIKGVPEIREFPKVMQQVRELNRSHDASVSGFEAYRPFLSNAVAAKFSSEESRIASEDALSIAKMLGNYFEYWQKNGSEMSDQSKIITTNILEDTMNLFFGTGGIMAMRGYNAHIHPLAQLSAAGRGLVDSAVNNVAASTGISLLLAPAVGPLGDLAAKLLTSTAFVGLTAGFILFYVLPFLPFVYFFFSVGTWVKSIFEAIVAVPLWALAHLRIDGEGLPGDSASNGYFLIFEIFLRPILTVFGLLASMIIFTAQVRVLHFVWLLVIDNLTGVSGGNDEIALGDVALISRGTVDQFLFTITYTVICYTMATACFKLIDKIPDHLLRWMGSSAAAFSDINDDPIEGLTRYAALGGLTVGKQATEGLQQMAGGIGKGVAGELATLKNRPG
jgi:conjugal transfer/type IV secretion protein DotA/TraY